MFMKLFRRSWAASRVSSVRFGPGDAGPARPATAGCTIEHLEPRRFLSASLKIENLDIVPGFERMIFNRIANKNPTYPNYVKDRGTVKFTNVGDKTLTLSGLAVKGPFKLLNALPATLPVGKSVSVGVQFTATKPPAYTYNQTNHFNNPTKAGAYIGSFSFKTNDPSKPTWKQELAGWFQTDSEKNQEPGLQTIVNLLSNYKTNIAPPKTVTLSQPTWSRKLYGEEVASAYWKVANTSKGVTIRQLAAFHSQGAAAKVGWYKKADKVYRHVFTSSGLAGQTFLPFKEGQPGVKAVGTFYPGNATTFGFKVDKEWSDDKLNQKTGGGHHFRFYPVRDHFGKILPTSYFMVMDYSAGTGKQNWDFQDNVYLVNNIKPAGN